ncbi:MAG: hypothetical protein E6J60_05435 [Deltaproteobacteria bacterium]|nr:MAG: hypothetical protein E6J60_05435 [Deltaproteobacteria bacterium]
MKGPGALLIDTFRMYGSHWAGLVLACAVLWVPAVVVKQATYRLVAPGISDWRLEATAILREKSRTGRIDPEAAKSVRSAMEQALGGRAVRVLGRVTGFLLDDLIIPLIGGALSILVANRLLGGGARVRDAWTAVLGRLPRLLSALIPAAILRMLLGRIVPYAVVPVLFVPFVVSVALSSSPPATEFVVWASLYLDLALTSLVMTLVFVFIPAVVLFEDLPCLSGPRYAHGHPRTRGDPFRGRASSLVVPRRRAHGPIACSHARPHAAPGGRGGAPLFRSTAQARWFR